MRRILRHRFRRTTLWLWLFISILGGLGLAYKNGGGNSLYVLCAALFLFLSFRRRSWLSLVLVILFGLSLGWWRGAVFIERLASYEHLHGTKISLFVTANEDAAYNQYSQLAFTAGDVTTMEGDRLVGKIQISGFGANSVFQGDRLMVTGKLNPTRSAAQGRMSFATLQVLERHPSLITEIRRKFMAGMQTALPQPLAPFAMGLLVGQRATLSEEVKEDLQTVGLTHIIAVSGYNLTIIVQATSKLLGKRSKRISTFLMLALIGFFLLITGGSAPIVRAAIVSVLSIAAAYYGRSFKPLNLICLAAALTAFVNPVYIWKDLSWYLSFLGFAGVMILAPLVQARFAKRWGNSLIGGVALESICAEMMTLPFVLHIFGQMSRVGLVANVLVVTMIPLAMLLGAIAGLAGMIAPAICGWFAWPAVLLLNYMLDVAHLLANLPNVFVKGIGLSLVQMLILYGCVTLLVTVLWYKNPSKSAIITDMNEPKTRGLLS
jgi:ComEC/Rec2-related protein